MTAISAADRAFFDREGYLVVRQAVAPALVGAVVAAIWDFLEMDPTNPDDWYREPHRTNGMVELYHHPALWAVRQDPRLHRLFADLWGQEDLWVSLDRANMKPPPHPAHPEYAHPGMVHWDMDVRERPLPFRLQGVLYLSDTPAGAGGFQCVPGFHRRAEAWAASRPADEALRVADVRELDPDAFRDVQPIPGAAGDLIVWHSALPHGNSANTSDLPRLAQYVTMFPADPRDAGLRDHRIASWRERAHPAFQGRAFVGDPRGWEAAHYDAPPLTPLGRRLLGLDDWPV